MMDQVEQEREGWSPGVRNNAIEVLAKIQTSLLTRSLPRDVYEAHLRTYKKISTEGVFLNGNGWVFLAQRPDVDQEPYPGKWHAPGVTHAHDEHLKDTQNRLIRQELGDSCGAMTYQWYEVGNLDYNDSIRGVYQFRVFLSYITVFHPQPNVRRGRFFKIGEVFSLDLVEAHKNLILPAAFARARELGWL